MKQLLATILAHMPADVLLFPWLKVLVGALGWLTGWWLQRKKENAASQQQGGLIVIFVVINVQE